MAKKKAAGKICELPVSFLGLSVGDLTARIGVTISRGNLSATKADKMLCGKRLSGTIIARTEGAQGQQESLPLMDADSKLTGMFDVKSVGLSGKHITCGLTFVLKSIDISELAHFPKREGMLLIDNVEDLPDGEDEEEDDPKTQKRDRSDQDD